MRLVGKKRLTGVANAGSVSSLYRITPVVLLGTGDRYYESQMWQMAFDIPVVWQHLLYNAL